MSEILFSYAGIGSRQLSSEQLEKIKFIASKLSKKFALRTGNAEGADYAFMRGCGSTQGIMGLYLPWENYNREHRTGIKPEFVMPEPSQEAYPLAQSYHPAWERCSAGAQRLLARNMHIVLGQSLNNPVLFVVCAHEQTGGTQHALRCAEDKNIPIFDLADHSLAEISAGISAILKNKKSQA